MQYLPEKDYKYPAYKEPKSKDACVNLSNYIYQSIFDDPYKSFKTERYRHNGME